MTVSKKKIMAISEQLEVADPMKKIPHVALNIILVMWGAILVGITFGFWVVLYHHDVATSTSIAHNVQTKIFPSAASNVSPYLEDDHELLPTPKVHRHTDSSSVTTSEERRYCATEDCKALQWIFGVSVTYERDPCSNFYAYACGGILSYKTGSNMNLADWLLRQASLNQGMSAARGSYVDWTISNVSQQIEDSLKSMRVPASRQTATEKAAALFQSCLDRSKEKDRSIEAVVTFLREAELQLGQNFSFDPIDTMVFLLLRGYVPVVFTLIKEGSGERVALRLRQSDLFLYWKKERDYLFRRRLYTHHVEFLTQVLGTAATKTQGQLANDIRQVEEKVTNITGGHEGTGSLRRTALAQFGSWKNNTQTNAWAASLGNHSQGVLPGNASISFTEADRDAFVALFRDLREDELQTYISWEATRTLAYLAGIARYSDVDFQGHFCRKLSYAFFPNPTLAPLFSSRIHKETMDSVMMVAERIKRELRHSLQQAGELAPEDTTAAVQKLDGMDILFVSSMGERSFDGLDEAYADFPDFNGPYMANLLVYGRVHAGILARVVTRPSSRDPEAISEAVMPFYLPDENKLVVPPAALLPPSYTPGAPPEFNYGYLGSSIVREMIRSFGNDGGPWSWGASNKTFAGYVSCLERTAGMAIGKSPIGASDYIADSLTRKSLYRAFRKRSNIETPLPIAGTEGWSRDQLFFISSCLQHCGTERLSEFNVSTLSLWCNVPLMNSGGFADAFYCPSDSYMNPQLNCGLL